MHSLPSTAELNDACSIIFGPNIKFSLDFIKQLQPDGLKAAYHKKALETHPDRARSKGGDISQLNELFIRANLAYEKLCSVINDKGSLFQKPKPAAASRTRTTYADSPAYQARTDHFFNGKLPRRKLLIGQFLYYSGLISWNSYINAIIWQRRQRPSLGQIAQDWNMLSTKDIYNILLGRYQREKFGESAIRQGYLTPYQLMALLGKQRRLQPFFGEYFVNNNDLSWYDLEEMVRKQSDHNRQSCYSGWL